MESEQNRKMKMCVILHSSFTIHLPHVPQILYNKFEKSDSPLLQMYCNVSIVYNALQEHLREVL
jgi:hypothetical protein